MPDRSSHQGLPEDWNHGSHAARAPFSAAGVSNGYGSGKAGSHRARTASGTPGPGAGPDGAVRTYGDPFEAAGPFGPRVTDPFGAAPTAAVTTEAEAGPAPTGDPPPGQAAEAGGFLGALFDFGFTSFVTPKVIKVLYVLIVTGTVLSAMAFTIVVFKASVTFGFLTLVFGDPLFILIVLAIYRIILEFFVVAFRAAEDIRALRERGDLS